MKKTYEVELRRTSYITVTVEAENEEQAEALAFDEGTVKWDGYANWEVESIEEVTKQGE